LKTMDFYYIYILKFCIFARRKIRGEDCVQNEHLLVEKIKKLRYDNFYEFENE